METIRGKMSLDLDSAGLKDRLTHYQHVLLDLGTGDGRYARFLAERHSGWFVIGVDSCRENLREHSRAKLPNLLYVIASAQNLPHELDGLVSQITINFPWGSLLESLLTNDIRLMCGLGSVANTHAAIELRLNGGALTEAGSALEAGTDRIHSNLLRGGWQVGAPVQIGAPTLRGLPTTWARRLAHGRDPRAMTMWGKRA